MPIYEYECDNCEHSFEITQPFEHKEKKKCPECGKLKLYKVISEPIIIIKSNRTIGSVAEKNTRLMGRTKVQELDGKRKENQAKEVKPWYADSGSASKKELKKMTKAEKAKYIITGKKK